MENLPNDPVSTLITDWFRRVRESQYVHYACSDHFTRLHLMLGVPTIILTTLVGTAVFASLDNQNIGKFKIAVGLVSILAAILAGLQTFLGFAERAEKHRATAAGYASVRRKLEILGTFLPDTNEQIKQLVMEVQKDMDDLAKSSPSVPSSIHSRVTANLKGTEHQR